MIANLIPIYALSILKHYVIMIARKEEHENGPELASIDVRELGTGVTIYNSALSKRAQLLAIAHSERYARDWIVVSTFDDAEYEQWHNTLIYNHANNIQCPNDSALRAIIDTRNNQHDDRERDVS